MYALCKRIEYIYTPPPPENQAIVSQTWAGANKSRSTSVMAIAAEYNLSLSMYVPCEKHFLKSVKIFIQKTPITYLLQNYNYAVHIGLRCMAGRKTF